MVWHRIIEQSRCPICLGTIVRRRWDGAEYSLEGRRNPKTWPDVMHGCNHLGPLFRRHVVDGFEEMGFSGFSKFLVTPDAKSSEQNPPEYFGIEPVGTVEIDWSIAYGGKEFRRCAGCERLQSDEPIWNATKKFFMRFLPDTWSGQDFVICPRHRRPIVSRRVIDYIVERKFTNFSIGQYSPCDAAEFKSKSAGVEWSKLALEREREFVRNVSGLEISEWEK